MNRNDNPINPRAWHYRAADYLAHAGALGLVACLAAFPYVF